MKTLAAALVLALMLPVAAQADNQTVTQLPPAVPATPGDTGAASVDPEKLTMARSLIDMTHSDQVVAQMMKQFSSTLSITMLRDNPDKQQIIQHMIDDDLTPVLMGHMHEMQENSAIVYARNFSLDELKGLAAFYQSAVGQKYLQLAPQIVGETMRANHALIVGIVAEATAKLKQDLRKNNMHVPKEMGI